MAVRGEFYGIPIRDGSRSEKRPGEELSDPLAKGDVKGAVYECRLWKLMSTKQEVEILNAEIFDNFTKLLPLISPPKWLLKRMFNGRNFTTTHFVH